MVRAPQQLESALEALEPHQVLSLGCVDGRNIWLTDFSRVWPLLNQAVEKLGEDRVVVAPSCSLLHVPHDLRGESKLAPRIRGWLRFAEEKLAEVVALARHDEVAFRANVAARADRLPLRREDWSKYLDWAVNAFKLATSGVRDKTQIHTHMCYCEFEDILPSIAALDADVISMESARSRMELLEAFRAHRYPNEIEPGVYDIHSPRVPSSAEMKELLVLALDVLKPEQVWVNPDCGLKTRAWQEAVSALENMCQAAMALRSERSL